MWQTCTLLHMHGGWLGFPEARGYHSILLSDMKVKCTTGHDVPKLSITLTCCTETLVDQGAYSVDGLAAPVADGMPNSTAVMLSNRAAII
jgi:hypothetical protein